MICATLLAENGLKVAAIERYPHLPTVARAGGIDAETVRTIQRLGLAEEFEKISRFNYQVKVLDRNHHYLQTFSAETSTSMAWKPFYLVYLPELESLHYKKAEILRVSIFMDQTAMDIQQSADGQQTDRVFVTCRTSTRDVREEKFTLQASYLVGADGAKSFVREAVGVENVDLGMDPIHNLVIDFERADPDADIPDIRLNLQILHTRQPQLIGRWNGGPWSRTEVRLPEARTYSNRDD